MISRKSSVTAASNEVVTSEIKLIQNNFVPVLFQTWLHVKENKTILKQF